MSGIAYDNILTIFESAPIKLFSEIINYDAVVEFCTCQITKTTFMEYRFTDKEKLENFIVMTKWYKLPSLDIFGTKIFTDYRDGKFEYNPMKEFFLKKNENDIK